MDKKILIFLICLFSFAKGQILTETFPSFTPDTLTGTFFLTQDTIPLTNWGYAAASDWKNDIIASYDFTANGTITETAGSIMSRTDGTHRVFQGSTDYLNRNDATLNPGTGDFTVQVWVKTPASVSSGKVIANQQTAALGWQLGVNDDSIRANIRGASLIQAKPPISANSWYYVWARWDRDGNCIAHAYNSSGLVADTIDISALDGTNLNPVSHYVIGTYAPAPTSAEWDGGFLGIKWNKGLTTDKMLVEDCFLAENWKSVGHKLPCLRSQEIAHVTLFRFPPLPRFPEIVLFLRRVEIRCGTLCLIARSIPVMAYRSLWMCGS
jgi:hypothetical protein